MKLIEISNYELKVADEALLVKPIRKLWNQDRSKGKEQFYKQMSILYFVYNPSSNYSYIVDEKERMKEVLLQEGISDFKETADFKAAVEIYKKLCITSSSELLSDLKRLVANMRKALNKLTFEGSDEKATINNIKNAASITPSGFPTKVMTVRFVASPGSMFSSFTPSTFLISPAIASITFLSRPSLKFGTHSTIRFIWFMV